MNDFYIFLLCVAIFAVTLLFIAYALQRKPKFQKLSILIVALSSVLFIAALVSCMFYSPAVLQKEADAFSTESAMEESVEEITEITYTDNIAPRPAIMSSSRLGFCVYANDTPPQQSIPSYLMAHKMGFDIFVCNLRFTSDNVPVLHHDEDISSYARNMDGTPLEEGSVLISKSTYEELCQYDYGIYKGEEYAGTPIMTLADMLKFARSLGVEIVIELKTEITEEQSRDVCELVQQMGMENWVVWSLDHPSQGIYINHFSPHCRLALETAAFVSRYEEFLQLKTSTNRLYVRFPHDVEGLNLEDYIDSFQENDILFSIGTIETEDELDAWFSRGDIYWSVSVVRSNHINVEAYLKEKLNHP